jgi:uncharacterized protein
VTNAPSNRSFDVAAVEGLRPAIAEIPAIDQHAHLLAGPDAPIGLRDVLTESGDAAQIATVGEHPAYQRALRDLGEVLRIEASEASLSAARRGDYVGHTARLLNACRLEAMFVDDGFRPTGTVSLPEHEALVGCPVRRIVRVETEAESAAVGGPPLDECRDRFQRAITDAIAAGTVGLKTIAAYRCGLDLPRPSLEAANIAYDAWRRSGSGRLDDAALVSLFLADALEVADDRVPLQVHSGLGDRDQMLSAADPAVLQPQIDHGFMSRTPVVLLHCYPFVRHAGYLASIYPNVHLDLSLGLTLVPHRGPELVAEALELAPPTKLLFATDASRLPEMFLLGTRSWRESLARALGDLVDDGFADERRALEWARLILADNARRVYGYDDQPEGTARSGRASADHL